MFKCLRLHSTQIKCLVWFFFVACQVPQVCNWLCTYKWCGVNITQTSLWPYKFWKCLGPKMTRTVIGLLVTCSHTNAKAFEVKDHWGLVGACHFLLKNLIQLLWYMAQMQKDAKVVLYRSNWIELNSQPLYMPILLNSCTFRAKPPLYQTEKKNLLFQAHSGW